MSVSAPQTHTPSGQAVVPCLQMFITGSVFALGVFTVPVEQASAIPGALDGVWPAAMGLMHFISAPVMMVSGIFLDNGLTPSLSKTLPLGSSKTAHVRVLSIISSICYSAFLLAALATKMSSPLLVRLAIGLQSVPLGINYLLNTELLVAWYPDLPGFIVGCALLAYGLGAIVQSYVFDRAIAYLGCFGALNATAIGLTVLALILTFFMRWPASEESRATSKATQDEQTPLITQTDNSVKLPWSTLRSASTFWLYITIVFTAGAPYAFTPFFFKLGHIFGRPSSLMITIFQVMGAMATVVGLLAGWATDLMRYGNGFFSSGGKNLAMLTMLVQCIIFLSLIPLSNAGNFWGFTLAAGTLIVITSAHYGCSAIMARDLFGPVNSCIVFGIGAGLSVGSGEGISAELMAFIEKICSVGGVATPSTYNMFYVIGALWSLLGLLCSILITVCPEAFPQKRDCEADV